MNKWDRVSHWIRGIQTGHILTEVTGVSHMVGVRFKPTGVYPFLNFPVSESSDLIDVTHFTGLL